MADKKLFEAEKRLMEIIWKEAPIESGKLVKLANETINWNKSTTYTVLRKLIAKGFVKNEDTIVSVIVSREDMLIAESNQIIEESFDGSLPLFVTSFLADKKSLSDEDANAIIKLIKESM